MTNKKHSLVSYAHTGCLILIAALCFSNWNYIDIIGYIGDEFGYWGSGAQIAGLHWENLLAENAYYAYGYGLLLAPLFLFSLPPVVMYKAAVAGNIAMLLGSFELARYLGKRLFPQEKEGIVLAVSLAVTLLSNNIFQISIGAPETLLYFLFWCIAVCMFKTIQDRSVPAVMGLVCASVYLYAVHNRTIGIVLIAGIWLLCLAGKERKTKWGKMLICSMILFVFLFVVASVFREYTISEWCRPDSQMGGNSYGGMIRKIKAIFSLKGVLIFALSVSGKMFSQGVSCLIFTFTVWFACLDSLWKWVKEKAAGKCYDWSINEIIAGFLALCYLSAVLINAIHKNVAPSSLILGRVMMGRYTDFAAGPVLLYAILRLRKEKIRLIEPILCSVVFGLCTVSVALQARISAPDLIPYNNASLMYWMERTPSGAKGIIVLGACTLALFWLLWYLLCQRKKSLYFSCFFLLLLGLVWGYSGLDTAKEYLINKKQKADAYLYPVYDLIREMDEDTEIYYIQKDQGLKEWVKRYRFLEQSRPIHLVLLDNIDDMELTGDAVLMCDETQEVIAFMEEAGYQLLLDSGRLRVYQ